MVAKVDIILPSKDVGNYRVQLLVSIFLKKSCYHFHASFWSKSLLREECISDVLWHISLNPCFWQRKSLHRSCGYCPGSPLTTSKGMWNREIQTYSPLLRSVDFDFLAQDIRRFHTAAERGRHKPQTLNLLPDVCVRVHRTSHRVCCDQCVVNLWTDSNDTFKI